MSLLDVVRKVVDHKPPRFAAPILDTDQTEVFVHLDDIPYRFVVDGVSPGWWIFEPHGNKAVAVEKATSISTFTLKSRLPLFYVINCYPVSKTATLAVPLNNSDAAQRCWPNGEPRIVHLVGGIDSLSSMDVFSAARMGSTMLYAGRESPPGTFIASHMAKRSIEDGWTNVTALCSEFQSARRIVLDRIEEMRREEELRRIQEQKSSLEETLRWHLEFMDAELVGWRDSTDGILVRWKIEGREHEVRLRRDLRGSSVGICLSGTDSHHNLSSIIYVMEEARRRNRFDLPDSYR